MIKLTPEEKDEWARAMHAETVSAVEYDELSDGVRDRLHRQVEALHLRAVKREHDLLDLVGRCHAKGDWRELDEWCAERMVR